MCVQEANLDAFFSSISDILVASQVGQVQMMLALADLIGIHPHILAPGPLPLFDHCGNGVVGEMLLKSRIPSGTYHSTHQQGWDTIQKLQTTQWVCKQIPQRLLCAMAKERTISN